MDNLSFYKQFWISVWRCFLPEKICLIISLLGGSTSNEFSVFICFGRYYIHLHFWKDSFVGYKILVWNTSSYCTLIPLLLVRSQMLILRIFLCVIAVYKIFGFVFQHFYCNVWGWISLLDFFFFALNLLSFIKFEDFSTIIFLNIFMFLYLSLLFLILLLHVCWYV